MAFLEAIATRRIRLLASGVSPKKAKIINLSKSILSLSRSIEVSFNPASIKYTSSPQYDSSKVPDSEAGQRTFYTGNIAPTLDMDLLFDTTTSGDDVREEYIDFLVELTRPKEGSNPMQPPLCMFTWGDFTRGDYLSFEAVLCNLRVNYTYFLANGRPLRAEVDVTFKAPEDVDGGQNPTSRTEARKVWQVVQGQTLDWIAYQEYGDSAAWRHIAQENNIKNPRSLKPGMILRLTPLR